MTLTVTFDILLKNFNMFNIGHNLFVLRGRAFIFGMSVPYDTAFPMVSSFDCDLLSTFEKTLSLTITRLCSEIGLSYLAWEFLMTRLF